MLISDFQPKKINFFNKKISYFKFLKWCLILGCDHKIVSSPLTPRVHPAVVYVDNIHMALILAARSLPLKAPFV